MTNKTIDFLKVLHLRGPNIWTYRSVLEAWVDIHDLEDCPSNVIPGLPELVELHRGDEADPDEIRALEFETRRGYRLVLGLRRARDWAGMRSRAVAAAVHGLQRTHEVSVLDLDDDLETEAETGSADIEDRHALSLAVARRADAVVVVAGADLKGIHTPRVSPTTSTAAGRPPSASSWW